MDLYSKQYFPKEKPSLHTVAEFCGCKFAQKLWSRKHLCEKETVKRWERREYFCLSPRSREVPFRALLHFSLDKFFSFLAAKCCVCFLVLLPQPHCVVGSDSFRNTIKIVWIPVKNLPKVLFRNMNPLLSNVFANY